MRRTDATSDEDVARARDGNWGSLIRIYEEVQPRLFRFLSYRVLDPSEALAISSDAMVAALAALPHYPHGAPSIVAFCMAVARGRIARDYRQSLPSTAYELPAHFLDESEEHAVVRPDEADPVPAALRRLPAEWQELLALRILARLGIDEAAYVLGLSERSALEAEARALTVMAEWLRQSLSKAGAA